MSDLSLDTNNFLRRVRKINDLSQQEMSDVLAVSLRSYQRYESGDSELGISQFLRLLRIIDVGDYLDICHIILKNNFNDNAKGSIKTLKEMNKKGTIGLRESRVDFQIDESEHKYYSNEYLVGHWDWSPDSDETFWSDNMFKIYGIKDRTDMRPENLLQNVSDEDKGKIEYGMINLLSKGIPYHNHHVAIHSGKKLIINGTAVLIERDKKRFVLGTAKAYLL